MVRSDFVERAPHAELARRLPARAIVAAIVGVVAVDHDRVPIGGNAGQMRVELVLAVVTAVGGVGAVLLALELVGADELVAEAELFRNLDGEHPVALRIAGTVRRDRAGAAAKRPVSDAGEIRAIDTAAIGDDHGAERRQRAFERLLLLNHSSQSSSSFSLFLVDFGVVIVFLELVFLFVVVVVVLGRQIELNRREAGHLEIGTTFGATQLIAFVDIELVDFDVCVAFGAARHTPPRRVAPA